MPSQDVTEQLTAWRKGDKSALDQVLPLVYAELRRLARLSLARERPGHTLQPTALVHEAYLRLTNQREVDWQNRAQFIGIAVQVMRRILAQYAVRRAAAKRGGNADHISIEVSLDNAPGAQIDLIRVNEALEKLAAIDEQQARIVELRYFGGLTIEETAEVVGISTATVKRDWAMARAWLSRELGGAA